MSTEKYPIPPKSAAHQQAIEAVKAYKARALYGGGLEEMLRYLLECTGSTKGVEWGEANDDYRGLLLDILSVISKPEVMAHLSTYHQGVAGKLLVSLIQFFDDLKHDLSIEADIELYHLENYSELDQVKLQKMAQDYNERTDFCKADSVTVKR